MAEELAIAAGSGPYNGRIIARIGTSRELFVTRGFPVDQVRSELYWPAVTPRSGQ